MGLLDKFFRSSINTDGVSQLVISRYGGKKSVQRSYDEVGRLTSKKFKETLDINDQILEKYARINNEDIQAELMKKYLKISQDDLNKIAIEQEQQENHEIDEQVDQALKGQDKDTKEKLEGVEFIEKYLKSLYYENEFCNMFLKEEIEKILYAYSADYKNLVVNVFQIILIEVIKRTLDSNIEQLFADKSKQEIYNLIYLAYKKLNINDEGLAKYIEKGFEEIQAEIYNNFKCK